MVSARRVKPITAESGTNRQENGRKLSRSVKSIVNPAAASKICITREPAVWLRAVLFVQKAAAADKTPIAIHTALIYWRSSGCMDKGGSFVLSCLGSARGVTTNEIKNH